MNISSEFNVFSLYIHRASSRVGERKSLNTHFLVHAPFSFITIILFQTIGWVAFRIGCTAFSLCIRKNLVLFLCLHHGFQFETAKQTPSLDLYKTARKTKSVQRTRHSKRVNSEHREREPKPQSMHRVQQK